MPSIKYNDGCVVSWNVAAKRLDIQMEESAFKLQSLIRSGLLALFRLNYQTYSDFPARARPRYREVLALASP